MLLTKSIRIEKLLLKPLKNEMASSFLNRIGCVFLVLIFVGFSQVGLAESTEPVYRQAVAAFDAQNWSEAAKQFKKVYRRAPMASEAEDSLFFWGESLLQSDQFDEAKLRFDEYLRQWPEGRRARAAQFRMAEALMLARRYKEAKYQIKRFTTLYPSDPLLEYTTSYLAEIAIAEDKLSEAERLFNKVAQKYPKGQLVAENRLGLARVQASWGKVEKAIDTLKPLVQHRDINSRTYREAVVLRSSLLAKLGKTESVQDNGEPDLLKPHLPKNSSAEGSFPKWTSTRSANLQPIEHIGTEASQVQTTSVAVETDKPESTATIMWRKAQFFERSGKLGPALTAYEDLYRKLPHTSEADEARLAAANIYTKLQQDRHAKSLYDELFLRARKKGSLLDPATILFKAAQAQERIEAAGQGFIGVRKSSDLVVRAISRKPGLLVGSPRFTTDVTVSKTKSEAIDLYRRLLREFPNSRVSTQAAYRLAQHEVDRKDFKSARRYLEKSLTSRETLTISRSLQLVWRIAAVEKNWTLVRRAAERLLLLEEHREGVPVGLGTVARFWIAEADYRMGQYSSARHRFEALSKRINDQNLSWAGLVALRSAQALAQLEDFSAARRSAEKASVAFPDFSDSYEFDYLIGQCAFAQGEYTTARDAFSRVACSPIAQRTKVSILAREAIASTFFAQKDYDSAISEFTKLQNKNIPSSHRAKALHYTALCYDRLGKKSQAETLYQRLVDRYPGYPLR